ncbi:MAG TPA: DNA polymerase III subunit beta [Blastocatellia bacterium]|nr:DNA polymerase III subunit beta [Blastocatellia bacterium]
MRFSTPKAKIQGELNLLQGVVEKKNTIPILSNVLIESTDASSVSMVATDLDVSMWTGCEADVAETGSIVLQARKLFDIVRSLPDADISFNKEANDRVKITCGASEFKLVGQAKEHFPTTPRAAEMVIAIPAALVHTLINRTHFAITQEESRYALNGSLFHLADRRIEMVSTDGHRLALASASLENDLGAETTRVIVPKKALGELSKLTAGAEGDLQFGKDDNHLFFKLGHRVLASRMLSGQFPNYELVLPKGNDKLIVLNSDKFAQAIRRAALMADERSHGVKLSIGDGRLNITAESADVGEAREVIAVDYSGDSVGIGFNAQYVLDFLGVVGTEQVSFEFKDEQSPALLRPEGSGDYQYVVMPMRLL